MPENNDDIIPESNEDEIVVLDAEGALLPEVVATLDAIPALELIAYIAAQRPDYSIMLKLTAQRQVIENMVTELDSKVTNTLNDITAACAGVLTHESDKTAFDAMITGMINGQFLGGVSGPAIASITGGAADRVAARQPAPEPEPEANGDDTISA